jgi:hypothetical protein
MKAEQAIGPVTEIVIISRVLPAASTTAGLRSPTPA